MISLCMIVRDEGEILEWFLSSVKDFVGEIVVVDTGSRDDTLSIAKKFTSKVYSFEWCDDFSKARNFSISKATCDWILILDCDEKIAKEDLVRLNEIASNGEKDVFGYRLIQETYFNDKVISIRGICRLFRNDEKIKFVYPIHETVRESIKNIGRIGKTGIVVKHYPKLSKKKKEYYLRLLEIKKDKFPLSNVLKEIEMEDRFNPH